jgi:hypothetical protein
LLILAMAPTRVANLRVSIFALLVPSDRIIATFAGGSSTGTTRCLDWDGSRCNPQL